MKVHLNEEQVLFIENKLEELGLNYAPLQGEILDHFCCLTEEEMEKGKAFNQATKTVFEIFGKDELKRLQEQTISLTHQTSSHMKNIVFAFFTSFIILGSFFFFPKEEKINVKKVNSSPCPHKITEIGLVGNSGMSTSPHLHYEVIKNGKKVNPKDYYTP